MERDGRRDGVILFLMCHILRIHFPTEKEGKCQQCTAPPKPLYLISELKLRLVLYVQVLKTDTELI